MGSIAHVRQAIICWPGCTGERCAGRGPSLHCRTLPTGAWVPMRDPSPQSVLTIVCRANEQTDAPGQVADERDRRTRPCQGGRWRPGLARTGIAADTVDPVTHRADGRSNASTVSAVSLWPMYHTGCTRKIVLRTDGIPPVLIQTLSTSHSIEVARYVFKM